MIRVTSVTIREFRGIRDLSLDLKDANYAICGPNGTGKSGVVDAIEFVLTGNISRLTGRGAGVVSIKEHAPHVDSRNHPDKALVKLELVITKTGKKVTIERSVKSAGTPKITPNDPDVLDVLKFLEEHPEFVLSRRELIRYIISTPGDRAKEVQALLRLDKIEDFRVRIQKIANACEKELNPIRQIKSQTADSLASALNITQLLPDKILETVNEKRKLLGLEDIRTLLPATSLKDGLITSADSTIPAKIAKVQARVDIADLKDRINAIGEQKTKDFVNGILEDIIKINSNPTLLADIKKQSFLQSALELFENEKCPACDLPWTIEDFQKHLTEKLELLKSVADSRTLIEGKLETIIQSSLRIENLLELTESYGALLQPAIDTKHLTEFRINLTKHRKKMAEFLPVVDTSTALQSFLNIPTEALEELSAIELAINKLPEPSQQDAAREFLIVAQERLVTYRTAALRNKRAEEKHKLASDIHDIYNDVSTRVLDTIYKEVQKEFSELYRFINIEDESKFEAHLTPSIGKLGFDVDFYGRGFFPPGAYHSEGHQDGMGLCLYLALMKHLLGEAFTFAVLDDVLMSVDVGHRRKVCELLKEKFPSTQFILTTHDKIWLKQMKSNSLISSAGSIQFLDWHVDIGPKEWKQEDVWTEIRTEVAKDNVPGAAALLRQYLEHISAELCHYLRAKIEFRADANFQLGDLLPSVMQRFRKLLGEAKRAADSWGKTTESATLDAQLTAYEALCLGSNAEIWHVNAAVHYNEWENFSKEDFTPVVDTMENLIKAFACSNCHEFYNVVPERGEKQVLKCACGAQNLITKSTAI